MSFVRKSRWRSKNQRSAQLRRLAQMRAAKERKRMERATAEPELPDASHIYVPRVKPRIEVRVRIDDRWFSVSAHDAPWGGIMPSRTNLARFVHETLALA